MATRSLTRQIQQAYLNPSRLFPFSVQQQGLFAPAYKQDAEKTLHESVFSPSFADYSQQPWAPRSGLGFPLHSDEGQSDGSLRATLSSHFDEQLHAKMQRLGLKPSLIPLDEVQVQDCSYVNSKSLWKLTDLNYFPPSTEVDEVILPSQNEDVTRPMLMSTKRTFNPSTIVRKRRHGFLARKATVGGRRVLARRFAKGRRRLSA